MARRTRRFGPWPRSTVKTAALVVGLVVAGVLVFWLLPTLFTRGSSLSAAERQSAMADVRSSLLTTAAVLGAVFGLANTARSYRLNQVGHLTGRFQDASKLMGESDGMTRLGGIEAMAQLADEWRDQRQRCIDMLCAHVRLTDEPETRRRVFEIIQRSLGPDQAWAGCHFDFRQASLHGVDLGSVLVGEGTTLDFTGARFDGRTSFDAMTVDGGSISFRDATFSGIDSVASFDRADLRAGAVRFDGASLAGGVVTFRGTSFGGCVVTFTDTRISASAKVRANEATITAGSGLSFAGMIASGEIDFAAATVRSIIPFDGTEISRSISFDRADLRDGGISLHGITGHAASFTLVGAQLGSTTRLLTDHAPDQPCPRCFELPTADPQAAAVDSSAPS